MAPGCDPGIERVDVLVIPQLGYPFFDRFENQFQDVPVIIWPRSILAFRPGDGRGMKMISCVMGIRVSIPATHPDVLRTVLLIVDFEVVVRIPANAQCRLRDLRGIVHGSQFDHQFEMTIGVRDVHPVDRLGRAET